MTPLQFGTAIHRAILEGATAAEAIAAFKVKATDTAIGRAFGVAGVPARPQPRAGVDILSMDGRVIELKTVSR